MTTRFKSRKFLMCLAAALGSIGTAIAGVCTDNEVLTVAGAICLALSTGIYTFCEAWIDGKAVEGTEIIVEGDVITDPDQIVEKPKE